MLVFEGILVYFGTEVSISNMAQQSSSLLMPIGVIYAAIPVGGVLMIIETVRVLMNSFRGRALYEEAALTRQVD